MKAIPWNLGTTFGAIGAAIAYVILHGLIGFHWAFMPSELAGLAALYGVSTWLGTKVLRSDHGRDLFRSLFAGVLVALASLIAGTLAIAVTSFSVAAIDGINDTPCGQPVWNAMTEVVPDVAADFLMSPVLAGVFIGFLPATVLGIVFGALIYTGYDVAEIGRSRKGRWLVGFLGGVLALVMLIVAFVLVGRFDVVARVVGSTPHRQPIVISGCGEQPFRGGVIGYCTGVPCNEQGACDWNVSKDAFAVYVVPPRDSGWKWAGGGMGTARSPEVVAHRMTWAQFEPNGSLTECSPRRYLRYAMRFKGEFVELGDQRFVFEPGMQLVVRIADDWSVSAASGEDALAGLGVTGSDLQAIVDSGKLHR